MLDVWTKYFPDFSFSFPLPCKTTVCSCSVALCGEFVQFCVAWDTAVWALLECSNSKYSSTSKKIKKLTSGFWRPMWHNVYMWISEPWKPSPGAYVGVSTGQMCFLEAYNLRVSSPTSAKTVYPQTKTVILPCSFGSSVAITTGTIVLFCQCTRKWYLGKVYVPGRGMLVPGFCCIKHSIPFLL